MPLVVEDGTGLSDADALVSLADFQSYCSNRGYDLTGFSNDVQERSIRLATTFIEGLGRRLRDNGSRWPGYRTVATQRRIWPRTDACYQDGTSIAVDVVPAAVAEAVSEAAVYDLNDPGMLNGTLNLSEVVSSAGAGPAKVTFRDAKNEKEARTMLFAVQDLLADILLPEEQSQAVFAKSVRA